MSGTATGPSCESLLSAELSSSDEVPADSVAGDCLSVFEVASVEAVMPWVWSIEVIGGPIVLAGAGLSKPTVKAVSEPVKFDGAWSAVLGIEAEMTVLSFVCVTFGTGLAMTEKSV